MSTGWDGTGGAAALAFSGVSKRYGSLQAVSDVTLQIEPGEIFALLGPNGAGKTTLIGCATGLIADFEGSISVAGFDTRKDSQITRRLIGLVPQELNFDGFFTAREVLFYQSGYFGVKPDQKRIEQVLKDFSLLGKADDNTRKLSGGMKRRLMICKALMHEPAILFLDEPTAGVDVELREELWSYVERLRENGVTVVLTTHYLEEAERLADRIGIISEGKLLRAQTRQSLIEDFGNRWLSVEFDASISDDFLGSLAHLRAYRESANTVRLDLCEPQNGSGKVERHAVETVLEAARKNDLGVRHVEGGRSSLEDVFRSVLAKMDTEERI